MVCEDYEAEWADDSCKTKKLEEKVEQTSRVIRFSSALPGTEHAIIFSYKMQKMTGNVPIAEEEDGLMVYFTENSHMNFISPPYPPVPQMPREERFRQDARAIRDCVSYHTPIVIYDGESITALWNSGRKFRLSAPDFSYEELGEMLRTCYSRPGETKKQE